MTHAGARWLATWGLTAALLACGALGLGAPAEANLPVESSYPVRTVVSVDVGGAAAKGWSFFTTSAHLERRAAMEARSGMGSAGLKPPARLFHYVGAPGRDGAHHMFDNRRHLAAYVSKAEFRDNAAGLFLVAIRTKKLPAFWKRVDAVKPEKDKDGKVLEHTTKRDYRADVAARELAAEGAAWFAFSNERLGGRVRQSDHDPVRTIRQAHVLVSVTNSHVGLRAGPRRYFDAKDKEITRTQVVSAKRERSVVLFVLSGVGLLGLALLIVRRARALKRSDPDLVSVA